MQLAPVRSLYDHPGPVPVAPRRRRPGHEDARQQIDAAGTWPDTLEVGPLPDVAGWVALVDGQQPFVLGRADRSGADIEAYAAASRPAAESASSHGHRDPSTRP